MMEAALSKKWDVIIVGGGITGAGILREAVRLGLRALLVERRDFAWGTSSRSSKLVHGGLRYLKEGHFRMTRDSVREREKLLKEATGLVEPIGFYVPVYKGARPGKFSFGLGLWIYDFIAWKKQHRYFGKKKIAALMPHINRRGLEGGFYFRDAQADDARLVLRLIHEAVESGGQALNYTAAMEIQRDRSGRVAGLIVENVETGQDETLAAGAIINATGAWAEDLHPSPVPDLHLRPLRGSHLIFPRHVIPLDQGLSFSHPGDKRPVFAVPWEGVVLVGTTDLDHSRDLHKEPSITREEVKYLMAAVRAIFPDLNISSKDCIATLSGIRPVLSEGRHAPSKESREHVVWIDNGLITVTGGKLTTFRLLAKDALTAARPYLPSISFAAFHQPAFNPIPGNPSKGYGLTSDTWRYLYGRYGRAAEKLVETAPVGSLACIPGTHILWAELAYAAKYERVRHLSDLMLRRVRIGLLTSQGGKDYINDVQTLCEPFLSWDAQRWREEIAQYLEQWRSAHGLPNI